MSGDYEEDYAPDAWGWINSAWESIKSGTYRHYVEDYEVLADPVVAKTRRFNRS